MVDQSARRGDEDVRPSSQGCFLGFEIQAAYRETQATVNGSLGAQENSLIIMRQI